MITSFFLQIGYNFVSFLLNILPNYSLPMSWVTGVYTIWSYLNAFSFIVPVDTLLIALGIALTFHVAIFLWRILGWIIRKIPGMH